MQRDVALLRGTFGIDYRTLSDTELFQIINEMWIYLFSTGKFSMTFSDSGEFQLNKHTF